MLKRVVVAEHCSAYVDALLGETDQGGVMAFPGCAFTAVVGVAGPVGESCER